MKIQIIGNNFTWGNKAKHCWVMSTIFLFPKVCWQHSAMFCLYTSSIFLNFPPLIWIFTEGKGDGIKFRLPFKIFSTLQVCNLLLIQFARVNKHSKIFTRISLLYINNFVIFIYLFKIERRVWKKEWLYWFLTICQNYTYSVDCQWRLGRSIPFWRSTLYVPILYFEWFQSC